MSSTQVITRTSRRTVIDSSDGPEDHITRTKTYQVYRGMSPASANRVENRMRELEDNLETEREIRMRLEKDLAEVAFQRDSMTDRLEELEAYQSSQHDLTRKRDAEFQKTKKDLELMMVQQESAEATMRKRHQEAIADLNDQLEAANRNKLKHEKDKQNLIVEIDMVSSNFEASNKARAHAESKLEGLDDQVRRLKAQMDDLTRMNGELNQKSTRLTHENFELQRQVQDLDGNNAALAKAKSALSASVDDYKSRLDEETRLRSNLNVQYSAAVGDLENANAACDEANLECDNARAALSKLQTEMQTMRTRLEKDLVHKTEELEDFKRRMQSRLAELEDTLEQTRSRNSKLEKEKNRLSVELRETTAELDNINGLYQDAARRLKEAEKARDEYRSTCDDLSNQLQAARGENQNLSSEVARMRVQIADLGDKNAGLARENKQLSEALREANQSNKDLSRQVSELTVIRVALEGERDSLAMQVGDLNDSLKDAIAQRDTALSNLAALRNEMELRLREKDEEIESVRKSGQRALDELQRTIIDIETRYKSEISRIKKKYETEIREFELQLENIGRQNSELISQNKKFSARVKDLEIALDDERRNGEDARQAVTVLERKRIALATELEDVRGLLETSERARKNADNDLADASTRINEMTISITTLTGDKRRMETDLGSMHSDLDEAINARRAAEDRADRLTGENARLNDELRNEQDNYKNAEALRKQLEVEIREITVRLEEAEAYAQREAKRMITKLSGRLRDLEADLETEQRRSRELLASNKKLERGLNEIRGQAEEDASVRRDLTEQINVYINRNRTLKRQLEEAEEVVTITMGKYRKAQNQAEEADHRADMAEKNIKGRSSKRAMSMTKEVTRVIRL